MSIDVSSKAVVEVFDALDTNHDGLLTRAQLADALRIGGFAPDKEELDRVIEEIDTNGSGRISKQDFVDYVKTHKAEPLPKVATLEQMFHNFDLDDDGAISLDELIRISRIVGDGKREIAEMIFSMADIDGDGKITLDELHSLMKGTF